MKRIPITPATELTIRNIRGFYIRKVTPFGTSAKWADLYREGGEIQGISSRSL
ncbi:MAG: DUF2080 family transposase-associated protein [Thermoplasmata archaeon]